MIREKNDSQNKWWYPYDYWCFWLWKYERDNVGGVYYFSLFQYIIIPFHSQICLRVVCKNNLRLFEPCDIHKAVPLVSDLDNIEGKTAGNTLCAWLIILILISIHPPFFVMESNTTTALIYNRIVFLTHFVVGLLSWFYSFCLTTTYRQENNFIIKMLGKCFENFACNVWLVLRSWSYVSKSHSLV